jgi:hypothetical protein
MTPTHTYKTNSGITCPCALTVSRRTRMGYGWSKPQQQVLVVTHPNLRGEPDTSRTTTRWVKESRLSPIPAQDLFPDPHRKE